MLQAMLAREDLVDILVKCITELSVSNKGLVAVAKTRRRSMAEQLAELVPFLADPKAEVRILALQHLSGCCSDPASLQVLRRTDIVPLLVRLIGDVHSIARHSLSCLINLSEDKIMLQAMLAREDLVDILVKCITELSVSNKGFALMYSMLLANLTRDERGARKLLQVGTPIQGLNLLKLTRVFSKDARDQMEAGPGGGSDQSLAWLATVLMNVAQLAEGRTIVMDRNRRMLPDLIQFTSHHNVIIRRGILGMVRNCCFASLEHSYLFSPEVDIVFHTLQALRGPDALSVEDKDGLPAALHETEGHSRETDRQCRKLHLEILVLLTASRQSRETLRLLKVYPIVREFDKALKAEQASAHPAGDPEEDDINDLILKVVEVLINDEAEEDATKTEDTGPKIEEIEEI
eukprot:TRINITY_DN7499_c0_g1_i1.p1 TRINITY_DN7499_c0_g1~~TRINITY_DN7499_c0_g1_i1.p1  ORF type:complete len:405 (-),score=66.75 TRINITY_DN7499_c0_g1_i1:29-1243(-)